MKYYKREVTERKAVNHFGRLGYVLIVEYVKTNNIEQFNKGKKIKYYEDQEAKKYLLHLKADIIYKEDLEVVSCHASKYRK